MRPEFGPDDDEEKEMKKIEEKDPFEQKLKPISQDLGSQVSALYNYYQGIYDKQAWKMKIFGDTKTYVPLGKNAVPQNNGCIVIESLIWPGTYIAYHKQTWSQIYVGYGFKSTEDLFYPKFTEPIETEMAEYIDEDEPHIPPKEEKEEEEKDDEDKDEEEKEKDENEDEEKDKDDEEKDKDDEEKDKDDEEKEDEQGEEGEQKEEKDGEEQQQQEDDGGDGDSNKQDDDENA